MFPVDMTTKHDAGGPGLNQDTSPPPLTKLVNRKPSSPREFFEKLYGPDTSKDDDKSDRSSSPEIDVSKHDGMADTYFNINNNSGHGLLRPDHHRHGHLITSSSYLPAFPLPPHEVGVLNLENVPFPGGLAAFLARRARKDARARRQRTTFSQEQTAILEVEYSGTEYISRPRRCELAERLQLSETQIKIWFQNRRAKDKRIEKAHTDQHIRYLTIAGLNFPSSYPYMSSDLSPISPVAHSPFLPHPPPHSSISSTSEHCDQRLVKQEQ